MIDPLAGAIYITVGVCVFVVGAYYIIKGDIQERNSPCVCKHKYKEHVSPHDWDSNYGGATRLYPMYKKPYSCRQCLCREFISL